MYLIVGLGNPEEDYASTRHNMGFDVINNISEKFNIPVNQKNFKSLYGIGMIENEKVVLIKPQTYMNLSGEAVVKFRNFYKISDDKIILVYDDIDLEIGKIRIRKKGSAGTHNGMRSVLTNLKTEDIPRIRVGIGKPENNRDLIDYVIGKVPKDEAEQYKKGVVAATKGILEILKNGIESAMSNCNGKEV